jgi:shikimate dehydrogenase
VTWRLGVVGSPIAHSLSPRLHEAGLALARLEGTSERVELGQHDVAALREMMGRRFDALSVTMPLKPVAARLCDSLDEVASRIGVVNSLLVRDGRLLGACTDGAGLLDALRDQFGFSCEGQRAVVLGSGGAAGEIVDALVACGVGSVSVLGRTPTRVHEITGRYTNVRDQLDDGRIDLVVNTIPAPSRDGAQRLPGTSEATIAIDIAYDPPLTPWRSLYGEAGCRTANGLGMLAYQAALQMQWWWGVPIEGAALLEVIT